MKSVIRVFASRTFMGHWRSKLALAAVLFLALMITFSVFRHGAQQAAYALDDLPNRLLEIRSVYLTGWTFGPEGMSEQGNTAPAKCPLKIFAERPDCYWHTWCGFSGPDATHKDVRVRSGYAAGKGTKLLYVTANEKTAVEATVTAIDSELLTEMFIQSELPQQLLGGRPQDFVKTGTETVNSIPCDVYEHSSGNAKSRKRLWLDPQTGLPVKIASYSIEKNGHEIPTEIFDHVQVDIPASATGLSFEPPEGYRVTNAPQSKTASLFPASSSGSNDDVSLGVWHCFNIDDEAVLLCWYCEPRSGLKTNAATAPPEFLLAGTHPCNHLNVASADVGGHNWNWSLVWPKQAGERIGNDDLSVIHRPKQGGLLSVMDHPIHLQEDRLKVILEEVQRITETRANGLSKPFSLDTLRAQIKSRR